jgi:hypothetical protein
MLNVMKDQRKKISTANPFFQTAALKGLFQRYQPHMGRLREVPAGTQRKQVMLHACKLNDLLLPSRSGELMPQCWLFAP